MTLTDNVSFAREVTEECLYSAELRMKKKITSVPGLPDRLLIKGNKDIMNRSFVIPAECVSAVQFLYPRYYVFALALRVSVRPSYICLAVCLSGCFP